MSDTDRTGRNDQTDSTPSDDPVIPGETPADPAYASGAGFTGEATGATPPDADVTPSVAPDPLGSGAPATDPTRGSGAAETVAASGNSTDAAASGGANGPTSGAYAASGSTSSASASGGSGGTYPASGPAVTAASDDDKMMVIVTHGLNIAGVFTGGLGNLAAVILAFVKKDTAPEWARSHYVFAIRTVVIGLIAAIALGVLAVIAIPLSLVGIGLLMFPLIGLASVALGAWVVVRSALALIKANDRQPWPNPETWLI